LFDATGHPYDPENVAKDGEPISIVTHITKMTDQSPSLLTGHIKIDEVIRRCIAVFLVAAFASLLTGCRPPGMSGSREPMKWPETLAMIRTSFPDAPQMTTAELAALLKSDDVSRRPLLIDARSTEEYEVSHLAGAVRAETAREAMELLRSRPAGQPAVAYCSVGYRSSELVSELIQQDVQDVYNLEGSLFKWANERRPLAGSQGADLKVHPFDAKWGTLLNREHWPENFLP